jgi:hypothetical protein
MSSSHCVLPPPVFSILLISLEPRSHCDTPMLFLSHPILTNLVDTSEHYCRILPCNDLSSMIDAVRACIVGPSRYITRKTGGL